MSEFVKTCESCFVLHRPSDCPVARAKSAAVAKSLPQSQIRTRRRSYIFRDVVPGGAESEVSVVVDRLFRGEDLLVEDSCAAAFEIVDIKVGSKSQRPLHAKPTSAVFWSRSALRRGVYYDTADPGVRITLTVVNTLSVPVQFSAELSGKELL